LWRHGKIRGGWKIIENILQKLVENSQNAIDDGIYDITEALPKSEIDLQESIKNNSHASLITEIKFSSPAEGDIRQISDPVQIAKSMISGGAQALSILTQPYLFNGSPEYFIKIRKNVKIPLLMKDIMIGKIQIDAAKKMGADYFLLIQGLFDNGFVSDIDKLIDYGHEKDLKILLEAHTKTEFENAIKTDADIIGINNCRSCFITTGFYTKNGQWFFRLEHPLKWCLFAVNFLHFSALNCIFHRSFNGLSIYWFNLLKRNKFLANHYSKR